MIVFKGTRAFIRAFKRREIAPMRLFWYWLRCIWLEDLCVITLIALNPYVMIAVPVGIFFVILRELCRNCENVCGSLITPIITPRFLNADKHRAKRIKITKEYMSYLDKDKQS